MVKDFSECKYVWKEVVNCKGYESQNNDGSEEPRLKYTYSCMHRIVTNVLGGKNAGLLDDTLPWRILCNRCSSE